MKNRILTAALLVLLASLAFAQSSGTGGELKPDRGEIESVGSATVVFINYEGPESKIDSLAAIKGVGRSLGRAAATFPATPPSPRAGSADAARAKQLKTNADILRKYLPKPFDKESSQ